MFLRILLLLVLIPLIELALLHEMSLHAGWPTTILIVVVTGFLGSWLAKQQGRSVWMEIQQQMAAGKVPSAEIVNGVLILLAGAFLITPGVLTDLVGLSLLIPPIRAVVRGRLRVWFSNRATATFQVRSFSSSERAGSQSFADQYEGGPQVRVVDPSTEKLEDERHSETE
ncbi:MAG: FxsA family protein [Planctomycetaceae bacterium]|nr:FxsA family protein [Planctomycetaceae bacterium]